MKGRCPFGVSGERDSVVGPQIMLEEFGKYPENRDQFFSDVYAAVLTSASSGGPLKGVAFWQWYDEGQVRSR